MSLFAHFTHRKHRQGPLLSTSGFSELSWMVLEIMNFPFHRLIFHFKSPRLKQKDCRGQLSSWKEQLFEACSLCSVFSWVSCFQQRGAGSHQGTKQVQSPKKVKIKFQNWDLILKNHIVHTTYLFGFCRFWWLSVCWCKKMGHFYNTLSDIKHSICTTETIQDLYISHILYIQKHSAPVWLNW